MLALADLPQQTQPSHFAPWLARLQLQFGLRDGRTRILANRHLGPLRLQKLLHPQAHAAEVLLLHPPGGIAGGDRLEIEVSVAEGARVLLTTPGASKWYRSDNRDSVQNIRLTVDADSAMEWMPQEAILFDGCNALQSLVIDLDASSRMIGWDIVQLGRRGSPGREDSRWQQGRWRQHLSLRRAGRLIWVERADLFSESPLCSAGQGLGGFTFFGTLWACAPQVDAIKALEDVRGVLAAHIERDRTRATNAQGDSLRCAATWLEPPRSVLLLRVLGHDAEVVREVLEAAWSQLRPSFIGLPPLRPRIWST